MQNTKTIIIRQPFYLKPMAQVKRLFRKISFIKNERKLERNPDTWFGLEQAVDAPFRWSHPVAKLNIQNLETLAVRIMDPLGREVNITTKEVNHTVKLEPGEFYDIVLSVNDAEEVVFRTEPFNPESDTRSLGLQFVYITTTPCMVLN